MTKFEKWFYNRRPVSYLLNKSRHWNLPGFDGVPLYDVLVFYRDQAANIGFNSRAAAISFNVLMAVPAGLIFLCTLVPYLPNSIHFERELLQTIAEVMKDRKTYVLIADVIHDFFSTERSGLLSFSFIAATWFSSNAMMGIMRTFDRSYFEERRGIFMAKRWSAIKLTSLLVLLIFGTTLLLATQGPIKTFLLRKLHWNTPVVNFWLQSTRWILIVLLYYFTIAFIYRWAPAVRNKWSLISPGAVIATILTIATTWLFGIWVNNFGQFNKVYGSIGTILILMNLVFLNSLILLIGFELNVSITAVKTRMMKQAATTASQTNTH